MAYTDEQLIDGIRRRKGEYFIYLDKLIRRSITLLVLNNSGSKEDAEDCYMDSIAGLIKMVDEPDFELTCKLTSLVFKIAENQWLRVLKKRKPERKYKLRHNEDLFTEATQEDIDEDLEKKIYNECYLKLGRECRQIIKAHNAGTKAKEIANMLDYEYSTIRRKKGECIKILTQMIREHPDFNDAIKDED